MVQPVPTLSPQHLERLAQVLDSSRLRMALYAARIPRLARCRIRPNSGDQPNARHTTRLRRYRRR
ncbi:hypothetical protein OG468_41000 (plasmid) [Streptomyces zaomyceticus]|uniref:Integrase n=1 Tax=Streptomyces zaomyceticus TaxID=68286 RepID=A0ABZ1LR11_9ACTN